MQKHYQITIPGLSIKGTFPPRVGGARSDYPSDSVATRRMSLLRSGAADANDTSSAA